MLQILSTGAAAELERRRDHRHMHQLAYTDSITACRTVVQFMEQLLEMGPTGAGEAVALGIAVLLDLRRFKEINDPSRSSNW